MFIIINFNPHIREGKDLLLSLYCSLIYPHLIYGNIVWGNNYKTRLDSLIKIKKKVVRVITFSSYTESSKPPFQKLEILNVNQLNNKQTRSFFWLTYLTISSRIILEIFTFWIVNFIRMLHGEAIIYISSFTEQTTAIIQYSVKGRISIPDDLRNTSFPSTTTPPNF